MSDLAAFLAARWDEDERVAQGAARTDDGHAGDWFPLMFGELGMDARVDDHIALHDPARVLAEVAANRDLLDQYERHQERRERHAAAIAEWTAAVEQEERTGTWPLPGNPGTQSHALQREADYLDAMEPILLHLVKMRAAVHASHPDYDPAWAL